MNTSQRRVCFAANTKTHDGHSPAAQYFEDFIAHAKTFKVFTERDLLLFLKSMPNRLKLLPSLVRQLHRLVAKLGTTSRKYVRILPVTKAIKLPAAYFQWSVQLYNLLVRLCRRFTSVLNNAPSSTSSAVHSNSVLNNAPSSTSSSVQSNPVLNNTPSSTSSAVHSKRKRNAIETQDKGQAYPSTVHSKRKRSVIEYLDNLAIDTASKREQHAVATQGIKCH